MLIAGSLSGVLLLVVGFAVAAAVRVSVEAQRGELALLRAVGATPRQVRRLAAGQATAIALGVLPPGIVVGHLLAERFRSLLAGLGVVPADLPLTLSPLPAVATALLVVAAVQVAARSAAWRASRLPAVEAVARSHSESRSPSRTRTVAGLLVLVAALALSAAPLLSPDARGAAVTSLAGLVAAVGLAAAGPALARSASRVLARRLPRRAGASTWLAGANSCGAASRSAATVSTVAMAVVFVLTYALASTTLGTATEREAGDAARAQHRIGAAALGGVPADLAARVRATPGVQAADPVGSTTVLWPHRELGEDTVDAVPAQVLTPRASDVLDLDVRAGRMADLTGATVAVGSGAARSRDAALGSRVRLVLGDGTPIVARVVAVYGRDLGVGPIVLSRELAAGHTAAGLDPALLVRTDGTAGATAGLAALVAAQPGLTLEPSGPGATPSAPPETAINLAVLAVLLGYLLLGIVNGLVATSAQRRAEVDTLRLLGATRRQVLSMVRQEAAMLGSAALVAGVAVSAVPLALLGTALLGRPLPAGPLWLLPATALTVAAIALLTVELPTRRALRCPPVGSLSLRG